MLAFPLKTEENYLEAEHSFRHRLVVKVPAVDLDDRHVAQNASPDVLAHRGCHLLPRLLYGDPDFLRREVFSEAGDHALHETEHGHVAVICLQNCASLAW